MSGNKVETIAYLILIGYTLGTKPVKKEGNDPAGAVFRAERIIFLTQDIF
jgi:hypothetical protein